MSEFTPSPSHHADFAAHGQITVSVNGALVHSVAYGPFNLQGVQRMITSLVSAYQSIPEGLRFVLVSEIRGSQLMPLDALECLERAIIAVGQSPKRPELTIWVVGPGVETAAFIQRRTERAFAAAGRPYRQMESIDTAMALAKQHLLDGYAPAS